MTFFGYDHLASESTPEDAKMHRRRAIRFDSRSAKQKLHLFGGAFAISFDPLGKCAKQEGTYAIDLIVISCKGDGAGHDMADKLVGKFLTARLF